MELYMLWLLKIFNKNVDIYDFIKNFNVQEIFFSSNSTICQLNLPEGIKQKLISATLKEEAKREYNYCLENDIKLLSFTSPSYPINLQNISFPPPLLYYRGTILPKDECSISIVGSRKYSEYGNIATKKFACELASCGVTIVSGMARGIDSFAHNYSLASEGRTFAVLGSGIDIIYPYENKRLYSRIIENGAVISEFPLHTPPLSKNFPIRNKIVAGLSLGTLIIEASIKSGTMITARLAGEYGRNVYAVPGSIFSEHSLGTNQLIKDGAKITTSSEDILIDLFNELNQLVPKPKQLSLFSVPANLSDVENKIYSLLLLLPLSADEIATKINFTLSKTLETLTLLELGGYIKELPGKKYAIIN